MAEQRLFVSAGRLGRGALIADTNGHCVAVMYSADVNPQAASDTKLFIAALPMLSALKQVLPYMESAERRGLAGDEGCHWPVEAVRAAIAEAEAS